MPVLSESETDCKSKERKKEREREKKTYLLSTLFIDGEARKGKGKREN